MFKLLVTSPQNIQEIKTVGRNGKYFDPERVVWDERIHGKLPKNLTLGGLERRVVDGENRLEVNQSAKQAHDDAIADIEARKTQAENQFRQAIAFLKDIDGNVTSLAAARNAFKAYNVILRRLFSELND